MKYLNPETLGKPRGYNNGCLADSGRVLFIAGQIGWDKNGQLAEGLSAQFDQALYNILQVLEHAGGTVQNIGRFIIYIKDKNDYIAKRKEIGQLYRKRMGSHYPAMSLLVVSDLLEDGALVEIEATAIIP